MNYEAATRFFWLFVMSYAVLALANTAWRNRAMLSESMHRVYGHGWRPYAAGFGILCVTIVGGLMLWDISPPVLRYGWLSLLSPGGGSLATAPLASARGASIGIKIGAVAFSLLLIMVIPQLVEKEERLFRHNALGWWRVSLNSMLFGAAHLLVGIPVIVAVALMGTGAMFAVVYLRAYQLACRRVSHDIALDEALQASVRVHSAYNLILVLALTTAVVLI